LFLWISRYGRTAEFGTKVSSYACLYRVIIFAKARSSLWDIDNKGSHVIHSGGKYDSFLQVPVIPPKYQAGDYVYR